MLEILDKVAAKKKGLSDRQANDLQLWKQWDQGGRQPNDMKPLLNNFRGMIRSQANRYVHNVEIPPAAIQAEFTRHFARAVKTYDPNRGAALGTWVGQNLKKGQRWISQHQNTARITEKRLNRIGDFQTAKSQLDQELGREPSTQELADKLMWSQKNVQRLETQMRKSYVASEMKVDPVENLPSREKEVMRYLPYELNDQERFVYEHTIGTNGKPKLTGTEIARRLNVSNSTVSRMRTSIAKKAKSYLL